MASSYLRTSDRSPATQAEACTPNGTLRDGYSAVFSVNMWDSKPAAPVGGGISLRDAAGAPVTLADAQTGSRMKLTDNHIAAIEAEAAKAGMAPAAYVADVLRYVVAN